MISSFTAERVLRPARRLALKSVSFLLALMATCVALSVPRHVLQFYLHSQVGKVADR